MADKANTATSNETATVQPPNTDALDQQREMILEYVQPLLDMMGDNHYIQAAIILAVSVSVAWIITLFLSGILMQLAKRTRFELDDKLVLILRPPLFYSLLLLGLLVVVSLLNLSDKAQGFSLSILQSISIVIWSVFTIRAAKLIMSSAAEKPDRAGVISLHTLPLLQNLAGVVVVIIAIYLLFDTWGINMTAWLASAGVVGIAVGFAAKDTLANFISGVFILSDAPYKIGDYIVLDSGERGEVTHIGIRSTRMLTRDDVEATIPNSVMGNSKIINESGGPHTKYRIRIPVGAAYGSDIDQVRQVLMGIAQSNDKIVNNPEPRVRFRSLGASSLDFELLCWVSDPRLRGQAIDSLLEQVYKRFNTEGIEIPYSKQDIYVKEWPELNSEKKPV